MLTLVIFLHRPLSNVLLFAAIPDGSRSDQRERYGGTKSLGAKRKQALPTTETAETIGGNDDWPEVVERSRDVDRSDGSWEEPKWTRASTRRVEARNDSRVDANGVLEGGNIGTDGYHDLHERRSNGENRKRDDRWSAASHQADTDRDSRRDERSPAREGRGRGGSGGGGSGGRKGDRGRSEVSGRGTKDREDWHASGGTERRKNDKDSDAAQGEASKNYESYRSSVSNDNNRYNGRERGEIIRRDERRLGSQRWNERGEDEGSVESGRSRDEEEWVDGNKHRSPRRRREEEEQNVWERTKKLEEKVGRGFLPVAG